MKTKIVVNDDKDLVKTIRLALKENEGYCPCKLTHDPENKCMCEEFRKQKDGKCHCGLYIKILTDTED